MLLLLVVRASRLLWHLKTREKEVFKRPIEDVDLLPRDMEEVVQNVRASTPFLPRTHA